MSLESTPDRILRRDQGHSMHDALDRIDHAIFIKDRDGRYLYCNSAATQFTGKSYNDIVGSNFTGVFGTHEQERFADQDRRVLETGIAETSEHELIKPHGTRILSITKSPYRDATGQIVGVIGSVQDITAHRNAEDVLKQQNKILESIATGAAIQDVAALIVSSIERELPRSQCGLLLADSDKNRLDLIAAGSMTEELRVKLGQRNSAECVSLYQLCSTLQSQYDNYELVRELRSLPMNSAKPVRDLFYNHDIASAFLFPISARGGKSDDLLASIIVCFNQDFRDNALINQAISRVENLIRIAVENHRSHKVLRNSELRFRHFVNNTADAFFLFDEDAIVVDLSNRACEYLGYQREELIGSSAIKFSPYMEKERLQKVMRDFKEGEHISFETIHRRRDGSLVPVDVRLVHTRLEGNFHAIATIRDISQQKEAEQLLRATNRQLSSIYNAVDDVIFLISVDANGAYRFESLNPAFERITGIKIQDAIGARIESVIPSNLLVDALPQFTIAIETKNTVQWELETYFLDIHRIGEASVTPTFNEQGVCTHLVGIVHDITDRVHARNKLIASEERSRSLIAALSEGIVFQGANGEILACNASAQRILGLSEDELCGRSSLDPRWRAIHEDGTPFPGEEHPSMITLRTGEPLSRVIMGVHKVDGEITWIEINSEPIWREDSSTPYGVVCSFVDVTASKIAQDQLRESRRHLEEAQQIARIGSWSWDPARNEVKWSNTTFELFGIDPKKAVASYETFFALVHPDDRAIVSERVHAMESGGESFEDEIRIIRPDGELVWLYSRARATRDANGHIIRVEGTDQDITARKRAEERLEESEIYAQGILQTTPECIKIVDHEGRIRQMNATGCAMVGAKSPDEVIGQLVFDFVCPEFREAYRKYHQSVIDGGKATIECDILGPDGSRLSVESSAVPIDIAGQRMHLAVTRDITERRRASKALRESEERYRLAILATNDLLWDLNVNTGQVSWSERYGEIFERPADTNNSLQWWIDHLHPDDRDRVSKSIRSALNGSNNYWFEEYRFRRPNGEWADIQDRAYIARDEDGNPRRMVGAMQDVTSKKQAEAELRKTSNLLRDLVKGTSDAVFVKDLNGTYLLFNEAACRIVGKSYDQVLGGNDLDLFDHDSAMRLMAQDKYVMESSEVYVGEETVHVNGTTKTFLSTKGPYFDESGKVAGIFGIAHDITERKRAQEQLQSLNQKLTDDLTARILAEEKLRTTTSYLDVYRKIVDQHAIVAETDIEGTIVSVNDAFCRISGYSREELIGKNHRILNSGVHPVSMWRDMYATVSQGGFWHGEICNKRKDGKRYWVDTTIAPLFDDAGNVRGYFALRADITSLKEAQVQAESASRSKSEFLANMSHEIRTPMTAILGYADILAEVFQSGQSAMPAEECIQTIKKNGEHLLSIINDILDISKIEADKMTAEKINVSPKQLVHDVLELMKFKSQAKGLYLETKFDSSIPDIIQTDPTRLRQILVNLVGNAIKFTEMGGVTIAVHMDHEIQKRICFDIIDTGIGLRKEQLGRLFQSFEQADTSMTRKFGGTGLGLRISKRLAEILGGGISVSCPPSGGCIFSASIDVGDLKTGTLPQANENRLLAPHFDTSMPRNKSSVHRPNTVNGNQPLLNGLRVLLVEDGPDNQRLIAFHLRKSGATVEIAENGKLAVEYLSERGSVDGKLLSPLPIDLILMDMQMPEMDGYQATEILRRKGCRIPIVALTAHAMDGDLDRCLTSGCDIRLTKPIDRYMLIEACAAINRNSLTPG